MPHNEIMDRHRREVDELAAKQTAEERALTTQHRAARLEMARRHEKELADAWRVARKERKP